MTRNTRSFVVLLFFNISGLLFVYRRASLSRVYPPAKETTTTSTTISITENSASKILSSPLCQRLEDTLSATWIRYWPSILNVSLPEADVWGQQRDLRSNGNLTMWLHETARYFIIPRFLQSILYPTSLQAVKPVLDILNRKLLQPTSHPPLRIMVFGGSLTAGTACHVNPFGMNHIGRHGSPLPYSDCAWPARLQNMFSVIFGNNVIEVTNMASGGTTSDVSAVVLEYGLWPTNYTTQGPDIVIWAHGINDAVVPTTAVDSRLTLLQTFQQATRKLQCRQQLPMVVYLDDFLGFTRDGMHKVLTNLELSTAIAQMTWWYQTMGISYANVLRNEAFLNDNNTAVFGHDDPLVNHPGMMQHISRAWTVLFNLLNAFQTACDTTIQQQQERTTTTTTPSTLDARQVPLLTQELLVNETAGLWKERAGERQEACADPNYQVGSSCEHIWVVNRLTSLQWGQQLTRIINAVDNQGWKAHGYQNRNPRLGWIATQPGALFETHLTVANRIVRYMTIISMKSYSPLWFNSTLLVTVSINNNTQSSSSFEIAGYHSEPTSVLIPHKFAIPEAKVNDTITTRFELVGGSTFKISGIGYCAR